MKRSFSMLLACVSIITASAITASAQKRFSVNHFGVKAGANIATASVDYLSGFGGPTATGPRIAYHFGGFVNIGITEKLSIQPELLFSAQGYQDEYDDGWDWVHFKINWNYINLPVLVQYAVARNLYVEAGPQLGLLVSANELERFEDDFGDEVSEHMDIKEWYKGTDFGAAIGIGYRFGRHVGANVRYTHGLTTLNKGNNDMLTEKNRVFSVGVFFAF